MSDVISGWCGVLVFVVTAGITINVSRFFILDIELCAEEGEEDFAGQSCFAGAADAGKADETAQGNFDGDVAEVVQGSVL